MGFRTIEISRPADIHVKNGQLQVAQDEGEVSIPIEDISQIFCIGPDIRLSTMALSKLAINKVALTTLDEKYLPTAIMLPFEGHARQSQIMHLQVQFDKELREELWRKIIYKKISNQARCLSILGVEGAEEVMKYAINLTSDNVDYSEALAAKDYFSYYHPGLNRRLEDPINSRLNYGYAVVRSAIARALVATGFHPTFGVHHDNQLNAFNLADDLIEPWRPMVDLVAYENLDSNIILSKKERYELAHVLHNACLMQNHKMTILAAIDIMCESLKRCYFENDISLLELPTVTKTEKMGLISE